MRPLVVQPIIRSDSAGDGHFMAPRGSHMHNGVDYLCEPGSLVYSPVAGTITKLGYPYGDDLQWRYVEITDEDKNKHRLFYTEPAVNLDQYVMVGEVVGEAQNIASRYPDQGMLAHIHLEIIGADGQLTDPEAFYS